MSELTPYLAVKDARKAMEWYRDVLGAVVTYDPIVMEDGRVGHMQMAVDGAEWMMADESPEIGHQAPDPSRGATVTLHLTVEDVGGCPGVGPGRDRSLAPTPKRGHEGETWLPLGAGSHVVGGESCGAGRLDELVSRVGISLLAPAD